MIGFIAGFWGHSCFVLFRIIFYYSLLFFYYFTYYCYTLYMLYILYSLFYVILIILIIFFIDIPWHGLWLEEAMEEGTVDLPQPVAWEGCMSEEVCCLAHVEVTDHHQVQLQRWINIIQNNCHNSYKAYNRNTKNNAFFLSK